MMQVCIQRVSRSANNQVNEGGQMSEGVKVSVKPTWLSNFEQAKKVCVYCKQGLEIEEGWHNQAGNAPKMPQIPMLFRQ